MCTSYWQKNNRCTLSLFCSELTYPGKILKSILSKTLTLKIYSFLMKIVYIGFGIFNMQNVLL